MGAAAFETRSSHGCFGGLQGYYEHASAAIGLPMRFSVFQPPRALAGERVPVLFWLAGLTCTEETFMIKAGAQRLAAEHGVAGDDLVVGPAQPHGIRADGAAGADGQAAGHRAGLGAAGEQHGHGRGAGGRGGEGLHGGVAEGGGGVVGHEDVDARGAVLPQTGDGGVPALRAGHEDGLGHAHGCGGAEQLGHDRAERAVRADLGVHQHGLTAVRGVGLRRHLGLLHVRAHTSPRPARNSTSRSAAVPSSVIFSPAARSGRVSAETITER